MFYDYDTFLADFGTFEEARARANLYQKYLVQVQTAKCYQSRYNVYGKYLLELENIRAFYNHCPITYIANDARYIILLDGNGMPYGYDDMISIRETIWRMGHVDELMKYADLLRKMGVHSIGRNGAIYAVGENTPTNIIVTNKTITPQDIFLRYWLMRPNKKFG